MSIIEAVREYLFTCPLLHSRRLGVDFLGGRPEECVVEALSECSVLRSYTDGAKIIGFHFVFAGREKYGVSVSCQLENSAFYEGFSDWLVTQSKAGNLPVLGKERQALDIRAVSAGYVLSNEADTARYQIQCLLTYYEGGN